ncbi:Txe/YoeB family addiction module toxin [Jiella sp. M17.18]|uniref:Txe/YoeB family addiction module toxin n=1 Tax=Jiella sp. M17.18 TaxID=3234247 RepID=UPI0034DE6452
MNIIFAPTAWEDYQYWVANDRAVLERLNALIKDASRSPFVGLGKPEPLVGKLKGCWSRRITLEHRLIYRVSGSGDQQNIEIIACRWHYSR